MMTADLIDLPECRECGASMPRGSDGDVCDRCAIISDCAEHIYNAPAEALNIFEIESILDTYFAKIEKL